MLKVEEPYYIRRVFFLDTYKYPHFHSLYFCKKKQSQHCPLKSLIHASVNVSKSIYIILLYLSPQYTVSKVPFALCWCPSFIHNCELPQILQQPQITIEYSIITAPFNQTPSGNNSSVAEEGRQILYFSMFRAHSAFMTARCHCQLWIKATTFEWSQKDYSWPTTVIVPSG